MRGFLESVKVPLALLVWLTVAVIYMSDGF